MAVHDPLRPFGPAPPQRPLPRCNGYSFFRVGRQFIGLSRRSCIDVDMPAHFCRPVLRRKPARKAALVFNGFVLIADVHKNEKSPRTGPGGIRSSVDRPSRTSLLLRASIVAQSLFPPPFPRPLRLPLL